jgi:hypothetical protein
MSNYLFFLLLLFFSAFNSVRAIDFCYANGQIALSYECCSMNADFVGNVHHCRIPFTSSNIIGAATGLYCLTDADCQSGVTCLLGTQYYLYPVVPGFQPPPRKANGVCTGYIIGSNGETSYIPPVPNSVTSTSIPSSSVPSSSVPSSSRPSSSLLTAVPTSSVPSSSIPSSAVPLSSVPSSSIPSSSIPTTSNPQPCKLCLSVTNAVITSVLVTAGLLTIVAVAVYFYLINPASSMGDISKNYEGVNYVPSESENIEVIINEGVNSVVPESENIKMVIKISKILKSVVL